MINFIITKKKRSTCLFGTADVFILHPAPAAVPLVLSFPLKTKKVIMAKIIYLHKTKQIQQL